MALTLSTKVLTNNRPSQVHGKKQHFSGSIKNMMVQRKPITHQSPDQAATSNKARKPLLTVATIPKTLTRLWNHFALRYAQKIIPFDD